MEKRFKAGDEAQWSVRGAGGVTYRLSVLIEKIMAKTALVKVLSPRFNGEIKRVKFEDLRLTPKQGKQT